MRAGGFAQNELVYFLNHLTLLVDLQLGVYRQGENLCCGPFRDREIPFLVSEVLIGLLQMKRDRVVNTRANACGRELVLDTLSVRNPYHIEVVDRSGP